MTSSSPDSVQKKSSLYPLYHFTLLDFLGLFEVTGFNAVNLSGKFRLGAVGSRGWMTTLRVCRCDAAWHTGKSTECATLPPQCHSQTMNAMAAILRSFFCHRARRFLLTLNLRLLKQKKVMENLVFWPSNVTQYRKMAVWEPWNAYISTRSPEDTRKLWQALMAIFLGGIQEPTGKEEHLWMLNFPWHRIEGKRKYPRMVLCILWQCVSVCVCECVFRNV